MPCHTFIHEESGETIDVYVPIAAPAAEHQTQLAPDGRVFKRVYAVPLAATFDTKIGDATRTDFERIVTSKKGMKVGDVWKLSGEMSEQRAQREGLDPVKERMYKQYERDNGIQHDDVIRREKLAATHKRLERFGVKVKL